MRYTRFIIMRSPVQSRFPLQKKTFKSKILNVFFVYISSCIYFYRNSVEYFEFQNIIIRFIGTHAEYDLIDAKNI